MQTGWLIGYGSSLGERLTGYKSVLVAALDLTDVVKYECEILIALQLTVFITSAPIPKTQH